MLDKLINIVKDKRANMHGRTVLSYPFLLLLAILFFQATFSVVVFPVVLIVVSKISSQNERGMYTAITMAAAGIFGPGLSPIVLGAIADVWSFQTGILMVGVLTTASCICIRWLNEI